PPWPALTTPPRPPATASASTGISPAPCGPTSTSSTIPSISPPVPRPPPAASSPTTRPPSSPAFRSRSNPRSQNHHEIHHATHHAPRHHRARHHGRRQEPSAPQRLLRPDARALLRVQQSLRRRLQGPDRRHRHHPPVSRRS